MSRPHTTAGTFTTDLALVVRSWDPWLAEATGIAEGDAVGRPLAELAPEVAERGLDARLRRAAEAGAVEVLSPAFHHYLIACPTREPSAHFTRMQQHVTIAPLRAGDAIVGVAVTLEDVTARLDRERELAARLGSADEAVRLEATRALAAADAPAAPLAGALGDRSWRVRRAAAEGLAGAPNRAAVDALLSAVRDRHRDPAVLNAALIGLAHAEQDVVPPVLEMLASPDSDGDVRTYAALALGLVADRRAVPALLRALDDADANVRFHAVEALGRVGSREAADAVAAVAETRDFSVAFAALDALAMIGEPSVAPRIVPLLEDDLLQGAAAEALGRIGREDVAAPLAALLARPGAPVAETTGALATLHCRLEEGVGARGQTPGSDPGLRPRAPTPELVSTLVRSAVPRETGRAVVAALAAALAAASEGERAGLVTVLGWIDGEGVERALTGALVHPTARRVALDALASRGAAAVEPLLEALASSDDEVRKAAAAVLGRVGAASAVPALAALLDDAPEVAVVAAGALGHIGDGRAFESLMAHLDHPQAAVRQAVVSALNSIGHPEMPARIRALLDAPAPRLRESAARIAGYFGYAECADRLLELRHDPDEAVRRTTVEQLAHIDDPRAIDAIGDALATETPAVRAAAARALAHVVPGEALPRLLAACRDADPWVRYYAARSAGHLRLVAAVPRLVELATRGDEVPPVRIAAVDALAEIGDPAGLRALQPLADDPDIAIARPVLLALGASRDPEALAPLLDALRSDDRERRLAALSALGIQHTEYGSADAKQAPSRRTNLRDALPYAVRGTPTAEVEALARADRDAEVRALAVETLARIGGESAVAALVELAAEPRRGAAVVAALAGLDARQVDGLRRGLSHADVAVRCVIVEALSRMRHRGAAPLLAAALRDESPVVRVAAAQALGRLDLRDADERLDGVAAS